MSIKTVTTCDVCGTEKKDTNHWWRIGLNASTLWAQPFWDITEKYKVVYRDACGQACAMKLFDRYLSNGTLEESLPPISQINVTLPNDLEEPIDFFL
jgi:hypothetical protein